MPKSGKGPGAPTYRDELKRLRRIMEWILTQPLGQALTKEGVETAAHGIPEVPAYTRPDLAQEDLDLLADIGIVSRRGKEYVRRADAARLMWFIQAHMGEDAMIINRWQSPDEREEREGICKAVVSHLEETYGTARGGIAMVADAGSRAAVCRASGRSGAVPERTGEADVGAFSCGQVRS